MNYRFFRLSRCTALAFLLLTGLFLSAQNSAALPDSLPNPDSLSFPEMTALAGQLAVQARNYESELSRKTLTAAVVRESVEQQLKTAKLDTLTPKATLDSLSTVLTSRPIFFRR